MFFLIKVWLLSIRVDTEKWLSQKVSYLGSFQVEGLGVVTQQHHIFLQVSHIPVFMVPHTFLLTENHSSFSARFQLRWYLKASKVFLYFHLVFHSLLKLNIIRAGFTAGLLYSFFPSVINVKIIAMIDSLQKLHCIGLANVASLETSLYIFFCVWVLKLNLHQTRHPLCKLHS